MELSELVDRMIAGEEAAWRRFLTDYGRLVYSVSGRLGLDEAEREDHFQAVSIAVHRSLESLRNPERLSSWLYNIAYRTGIDALRRRRPNQDLDESAGVLPTLEPTVVKDLMRLEEIALVQDALPALSIRCRGLLAALFFEEPPPSYAEIAAREGLPVGSIGPTRARCLEKLKNRLDELSGDHPSTSTDRKASAGQSDDSDPQETRE